VLALACAGNPTPASIPTPSQTPTALPPTPPPPPPSTTPTANDDAEVETLSKAYLDFVVETSPETATLLGIHSRDAELDDRSLEAAAVTLQKERALLARVVEARRLHHVSRAARTDLDLLEAALELDLERKKHTDPLRRQPETYIDPMNALFLMFARDYAPLEERARFALARIEKIPQTIATARTNLAAPPPATSALAPSEPPPKVWTQIGIEMAASAPSFFDEQRAQLLAALPAEKARIELAVRGAKKAYAEYRQFLERDLLPRSTGSFAAGRAHFELLLKRGYFLDQNADQVLALGEKIFAETDAQMTELARRIDPKAKGWPEVTARLKADHPTAPDLLPSYRRELKRARDFLVAKDVVPFPPGDDCEVIDTPAFQRATTTAAYDQPPPFDKVTKGLFFVTPVDLALPKPKQEEMLRENDRADQVNTAVHEAYPGHHLQLSFARRHPSIVRKAIDSNIFAEGWGLYSEELMAELGYYTDAERLMQLEWTLVRAARVIIDVGLHTKGMTFDDAVQMLTDKVHLERSLALSEVKRYTSTPTQPLSYLLGRQAILELRDRFKAREKDKFTLRAFHTEILSHGTIPPGLVAREMFER
jgi:uncharacterized protein (DUF885 family)